MVVVVLLVGVMVRLVAVVEGDGGGGLRRSLAVMVVMVLGCRAVSWRRRRGRRREGRLGRSSGRRRSNRLPVQTQVFILLAEAVQLDLQLLDSPPLRFQKLLLALDDVVEL